MNKNNEINNEKGYGALASTGIILGAMTIVILGLFILKTLLF